MLSKWLKVTCLAIETHFNDISLLTIRALITWIDIEWRGHLLFYWLRGRNASKELMVLEQLVIFEDVEHPVNVDDVAGDEPAHYGEGQSDSEDGELDQCLE